MTKIITCFCPHPNQDALHGKNQRVANYKPKTKAWGCTACGRSHADKVPEVKAEPTPA